MGHAWAMLGAWPEGPGKRSEMQVCKWGQLFMGKPWRCVMAPLLPQRFLICPQVKNKQVPLPHPTPRALGEQNQGEEQGVGGGCGKWGCPERRTFPLLPLPPQQCCIDLERGVLRLRAPFPELPFLPLYQEPGQ